MRRHIEQAHGGVNVEGVHTHEHEAKYTFCPNATVEQAWSHDHEQQYAGRPEVRERHVARAHGGVDVSGVHEHVRRVKDREHGVAKRLDMHPRAVPLFEHAPRAFFVIEGCIKADAVLSQGEAVFSVPSVTLWNAPELGGFADSYLREKTVFIVADADAHTKSEVMTQAKLCLSFLRRRGVWAYVALPPDDRLKRGIKGVDDYLGKGEGRIDDLIVLDWQLGQGLAIVLADAAEESAWRQDRLQRAYAALQGLALHADEQGRLRTSLESIARVMELKPEQVRRGLRDLVDLEVVAVDRPLQVVDQVWRGGRYVSGLEWAERPTLTLRQGWRATRLPDRRVGEVAGPPSVRDALASALRLLEEMTAKNEHGFSHRDLAILTDLIEGESIEEAAEGWYRNPESARRRTPFVPWATAMRHLMQEFSVFYLRAEGCTVTEIVHRTGLSPNTVRGILRRGGYNPRWLDQVKNPLLRKTAEETVAVLAAAAQKVDEVSP